MTARREPPPPIRQDLQHQHASHAGLAHERDAEAQPLERPRGRRPAAPENTR